MHPDVVLCHPGALPGGDVELPVVEREVALGSGLAHDPVRLGAALADLATSGSVGRAGGGNARLRFASRERAGPRPPQAADDERPPEQIEERA